MNIPDKLLPLIQSVQYPQRYIGNEIGIIRKPDAPVRVAFGFPDLYELGMSNLAVKIFYDIFKNDPDIAFERCYLPDEDMCSAMAEAQIPLYTLESFRSVKEADFFGITLPSELLFPSALKMLDLAMIKRRSRDRDDNDPIVIAGGPGIMNPTPLFDFFDILFLGEGEELFPRIIELYKLHGRTPLFFEKVKALDGVIIPSDTGEDHLPISISRWSGFASSLPPREQLIPITAIGELRYEVEIMRGCTSGCRFCLAGYIYRPHRERDVNILLDSISDEIRQKGISAVNLLSLSSGDYSQLEPLIFSLIERHPGLKISLPSLRLDSVSSELLKVLGSRKMTSLTFALEAGSEALRNKINKKISDDTFFETLKKVKGHSWKRIKLYFMLGLPGEKEEDIDALIDLLNRASRFMGKGFKINVSLSVFSPKPHTPYECEPRAAKNVLSERIEKIRKGIRYREIRLKFPRLILSDLECIFGRGDSTVSKLIEDIIPFINSEGISSEDTIKVEALIEKHKAYKFLDEIPFPHWRNTVQLNKRQFTEMEASRSENNVETEDCFSGKCLNCGVCDEDIQPTSSSPAEGKQAAPPSSVEGEEKGLLLRFRKSGVSAFISNNDLMYVISRIFRMMGTPISQKKGFSRNDKISGFGALPLGASSEAECFWIKLRAAAKTDLIAKFNSNSCSGLELMEVTEMDSSPKPLSSLFSYITDSGEAGEIDLPFESGNMRSLKKSLVSNVDGDVSLYNVRRQAVTFKG